MSIQTYYYYVLWYSGSGTLLFRQAESLLDVSDMSFDETGDLLGDSRRHMNVTGANKRRSSHR